jgi:hypothetical protein
MNEIIRDSNLGRVGESGFEERPEIGAINHLPHEKIIDWIKVNTEERLWIIKQVLPTLTPSRICSLYHILWLQR